MKGVVSKPKRQMHKRPLAKSLCPNQYFIPSQQPEDNAIASLAILNGRSPGGITEHMSALALGEEGRKQKEERGKRDTTQKEIRRSRKSEAGSWKLDMEDRAITRRTRLEDGARAMKREKN